MDNKNILNFFFELGQLKRIKHEGWRVAGVENPDSVADHTMRAAQIGFVLARLEKHTNPMEICTIIVFHDIEECRIGDIHKVANRYISADGERAVKEQTEKLGDIGKEILELWKKKKYDNTTEGIIAKDADLLEQAISAKEYVEKGYPFAEDRINNVSKKLQTKSAKKIIADLKKSNSNNWWQGLKKID